MRIALEDDLLDAGLIHFSHTDYLRDFQMYFYHSTYDFRVLPHFVMRYRFVNCVAAEVKTSLPPEVWRGSLDERLVGELDGIDDVVDGWVWATRFANMYPGATLLESSAEADSWSQSVGVKFYEARFEAAPVEIRLIFSDLVVERAVPGDSPFTVEQPPGT